MERFGRVLALVVLGMAAIQGANAAPFQNGSFELGPVAPPTGNFLTYASGATAITGWTVTGAGVNLYVRYWQPSDGSRFLDLSAEDAGGVEQTFDTVAGRVYRVSFDLAGNPGGPPNCPGGPDRSVQVQTTGGNAATYTFDTTGRAAYNMGWTGQTYTFTATGSSTLLSFASLNPIPCGPALDNVVVTDVTPTPVPATSDWGLMALASLLGIAAWRGRRRSH